MYTDIRWYLAHASGEVERDVAMLDMVECLESEEYEERYEVNPDDIITAII